jgi:phosphate-selective porin OprO and OprP
MSSMRPALATSAIAASLVAVFATVPHATAQEGTAVASTGYDKGFFIESADGAFSLKTQARVQFRWSFTSALEDTMEESRDNDSLFAVQRGRLTLGGHAFTEDLGYKLQVDFGRGSVALKDYYVDYRIGGDALVRFGQYKRPFSRQQITSSGNQELVDRAITDAYYRAGRDAGVMLHNNYEKSPELEWAVGLFNGTGENIIPGRTMDAPDTFNPALVGRIGYNQGDVKGYSEADLDGGPLRFGVAASVLGELDTDRDNASGIRSEFDYIVKAEGFSSTGGLYFATTQDGKGFRNQTGDALGFHLQAGYTVDKTHQVVGRYALIAPQADDAGNLQEVSLGYSLYLFGHGFKWQTDVTLGLDEGQDPGDDVQVRSQAQLSF